MYLALFDHHPTLVLCCSLVSSSTVEQKKWCPVLDESSKLFNGMSLTRCCDRHKSLSEILFDIQCPQASSRTREGGLWEESNYVITSSFHSIGWLAASNIGLQNSIILKLGAWTSFADLCSQVVVRIWPDRLGSPTTNKKILLTPTSHHSSIQVRPTCLS